MAFGSRLIADSADTLLASRGCLRRSQQFSLTHFLKPWSVVLLTAVVLVEIHASCVVDVSVCRMT
jgi:hypothetical protein